MRTDRLRQEFDLQLKWSVYPLHPEVPDEGLSLYDLFYGRIDVDSVLARLEGIAAELQLPFGERSMTYNSRKAQELGKWAEAMGQAEAFHKAVYHAYFTDGKNISQTGVLTTIVKQLGLSPKEAEQVLDSGRYAAAVEADWADAEQLGVTAVPTCIYRGEALVGFQEYEAFQRLILSHPDR